MASREERSAAELKREVMKIAEDSAVEAAKEGAAPHRRPGLREFMTAEHARLDGLLAKAAGCGGEIDEEAYRRFREVLLRHIRIEERILLPLAERKRGEALPIAARLRLDHGAFGALVMLPPREETFRALRAVLDAHNPMEEGERGAYAQCESLVGSELETLMRQIATTPEVPASRWVDSSRVVEAAKRVLARAGYNPSLLDSHRQGRAKRPQT